MFMIPVLMMMIHKKSKRPVLQLVDKKRQIRPPQRYGYADLVAYALTVAVDTAV
jgi:hypothetical protein